MASLDRESLFTNIPLDETIENCINDLFSNNDTVYNFIKRDLNELLQFASYESFFTFDNKYYCQVHGGPMGSSLGPTLAIAFLCHFEKQWLSDCPQDFCPNIYRRYFFDIFAPLTLMSNRKSLWNIYIYEHKTPKYQIYFRT